MKKKYTYVIYKNDEVQFIGFDSLSAISRKERSDNTIKIHEEVSEDEGPSAVSLLIDILNGGEIPEGNKSRAIICNETGVVYKTVYEASKILNVAASSLYPHLKGDKNYHKVKGLTFRYAYNADGEV